MAKFDLTVTRYPSGYVSEALIEDYQKFNWDDRIQDYDELMTGGILDYVEYLKTNAGNSE